MEVTAKFSNQSSQRHGQMICLHGTLENVIVFLHKMYVFCITLSLLVRDYIGLTVMI